MYRDDSKDVNSWEVDRIHADLLKVMAERDRLRDKYENDSNGTLTIGELIDVARAALDRAAKLEG